MVGGAGERNLGQNLSPPLVVSSSSVPGNEYLIKIFDLVVKRRAHDWQRRI